MAENRAGTTQGLASIAWKLPVQSAHNKCAMQSVNLPAEAERWIKLHRTHLTGNLRDAYCMDVARDFWQIKPFLPEKVSSIIDIGCGLAGIDVLLSAHFPWASITLVDSDGPDDNFRGGYRPVMKPFTSREVVNEIFALNDLPEPTWLDVGTEQTLEADLIVSLLSWGFHYPLETYRTKGLHIADIRKGQPIRGRVIAQEQKYNRCAWN